MQDMCFFVSILHMSKLKEKSKKKLVSLLFQKGKFATHKSHTSITWEYEVLHMWRVKQTIFESWDWAIKGRGTRGSNKIDL